MKILGISSFYHDSAISLCENGAIIFAIQEERLSRKKNDDSFPTQAILEMIKETGINFRELDAIVYYEKPFLKFERLIQSELKNPIRVFPQFLKSTPVWLKEKLFLKSKIKKSLEKIDPSIDWKTTQLLFSEHHLSHASSSFYSSPFESAAILTIDGVGEFATASIALGSGNKIKLLREMHFPASIGLFYSAMTAYLGFEVNNGEYKVMGLAPYGEELEVEVLEIEQKIRKEIVEVFDDGSIRVNQKYLGYEWSNSMFNKKKCTTLFSFPPRKPNSEIEKNHLILAAATQKITEDVVIKMASYAKNLTQSENLCLAGGVALNCVINGKLKESGIFQNIYVQPAAGDAGAAIGSAQLAYYQYFNKERNKTTNSNYYNSRLGTQFSSLDCFRSLKKFKLEFEELDENELIEKTVKLLIEGKSIGWFQGKSEFGPRALGGRSILANPLLESTQKELNLQVKNRESFRPFAPIILKEDFKKYFGQDYDSPHMLFVHKLKEEYRIPRVQNDENWSSRINEKRSPFPAVTHIDYSSRIQTVTEENDSLLFRLLTAFKAETGYGILVNTSFNVKDEPIVNSPDDAIKCYLSTKIDVLVLGNYISKKWNS